MGPNSATVFLLLVCFGPVKARHVLQYVSNITRATRVTSGELDEEQFVYCSSNITTTETEWMKKIFDDKPDLKESEKARLSGEHEDLQHHLNQIEELYNHTKGVHTLQRMYSCEIDDDGTTRGYELIRYDGEDFISLDPKTLRWSSHKPQAEIFMNQSIFSHYAKDWKHYLENECITSLDHLIQDANQRGQNVTTVTPGVNSSSGGEPGGLQYNGRNVTELTPVMTSKKINEDKTGSGVLLIVGAVLTVGAVLAVIIFVGIRTRCMKKSLKRMNLCRNNGDIPMNDFTRVPVEPSSEDSPRSDSSQDVQHTSDV